MRSPNPVFPKAQRLLARRDPVLKRLIRQIGPCTLFTNPDRFAVLVQSILSQQLSTRAAATIRARLEEALGPPGITPAAILKSTETRLRAVGLSLAKAGALRDLAKRVVSETIPLAALDDLSEDEIIARLVPVKGIGCWTAEMFLIFSLGRLDVLPVDDWGLRVGVQRQYGLEAPPSRKDLEARGEPWRPYRSIATWYFWRSLGFVPQSDVAPTEKKAKSPRKPAAD
jgi:DNA-3-methyladenine glycosylase II